MLLTSKKILITGASDGIGKSLAYALDQAGAHVIILGRNEEKLKQVAQQCSEHTQTIACDITDQAAMDDMCSDLLANQEIDILINNAGIWHEAGDLTSISDSDIEKVLATNLTAHILLTKKLLPHMRERETAIVNIISKAGVFAQKGLSVYSASKYGMRGFTDVLREDTKGDTVRIAAIYQAGTRTSMFEKSGQELAVDHFTEPADLAEMVRFMLAQPDKIWLKEVHVEY